MLVIDELLHRRDAEFLGGKQALELFAGVHQALADDAAGDVSKAWIGLPDRARENAAWVMSESVRETVAGWGDAFGNRTVDLGGRLTKLRDRPVYSTDKFPAIATTTGSANQMVVGDFSGYLIVQRAGMTVEPVQTVFNGDGFPIGQRGLFAWARIGADVIDAGKLRLLRQ